jgi:hypothetical protein
MCKGFFGTMGLCGKLGKYFGSMDCEWCLGIFRFFWGRKPDFVHLFRFLFYFTYCACCLVTFIENLVQNLPSFPPNL